MSHEIKALLKKNEILGEMVKIVLPVAEKDPLGETPSAAYRLLRSALRRNIMRVQAIKVLNASEKMSDSALEVVRNMIEDAVSVSYILSSHNPEALAFEFFEYRWIQAKQDLDYYSKLPDYVGRDLEHSSQQVNQEYRRVLEEYPNFVGLDGNPRYSWSKDGIEGMANSLVNRKVYSKQDKRNFLRAYQIGSRKTHFNPQDLLGFYDQGSWDKTSLSAMDIGIKGAAASLTSLTVRYFDAVHHYDKKIDGKEIIEELYNLQAKIHKDD